MSGEQASPRGFKRGEPEQGSSQEWEGVKDNAAFSTASQRAEVGATED